MRLILIRHGLPVIVENGDGTPANPALDPEGKQQAERVGQWLAEERIDRIYSSPMLRARQTAAPLARAKGLEVEVDNGIAEFDQNSEQYVPLEKLRIIDPARWKAVMAGGWDYGGMDPQAFQDIVVGALHGIIDDNAGRAVAVFCHGGVINMWTAAVLGMGPRMFFLPLYTSIHRFRAKDRTLCTLECLNETVQGTRTGA